MKKITRNWDLEKTFFQHCQITISRIFLNFLVTENIYEIFFDNIKKHGLGPIVAPKCFVSASFVWGFSAEGNKFWYTIHNKWLTILEANYYD